MKILTLFLLFVLCVLSSEAMDPMTVDQMSEVFGSAPDSVNVYGYAEIPIFSTKRMKRSSKRVLNFDVRFADGTHLHLNMVATDGLLFDTDTPVWKVKNNNGDIEYTRDNTMLTDLGAYTIYQDFANKAALIVFEDADIVEGYVKHYRFDEARLSSRDYKAIHEKGHKMYMLVDDKENEAALTEMASDTSDSSDTEINALRPGSIPSIIYPQILVVMNEQEALQNTKLYLRKLLSHWNGIDMYYSDIRSPKIKINIAAIVIPTSEGTAPWLADTAPGDYALEKKVDGHASLVKLSDHFYQHRDKFPRHTYDFIFSFTEHSISSNGLRAVGLAPVAPGCFVRTRGALIRTEKYADHHISAHELGHLLSALHDEDTACSDVGIMARYASKDDAQRKWTSCARTAFQQFVQQEKSGCLDNCPTTKKDCNFPYDPEKLPNYICAKRPADLCVLVHSKTTEPQTLKCTDEKLACLPKTDDTPGAPIIAGIGIDLQSGTVCNEDSDDPDKPLEVCHEGRCVPYTNSHGFCKFPPKTHPTAKP